MINKIRPHHIKLKRAYEPPAPDDGTPNIDRPIMAAADRIVRDGSPYESHSDGFGLRKNFFDAVSGWRQAGHPMRELDNSQPHFFLPSLPPLRASRPGHLSSSFRANRASGRNGRPSPTRYIQVPSCGHGQTQG